MKNKKLFAILTLVCFMFTLMPVAAFAADKFAEPTVEYNVNGKYAVVEAADGYTLYRLENGTLVSAGTGAFKDAAGLEGRLNAKYIGLNSEYDAVLSSVMAETYADALDSNKALVITEEVIEAAAAANAAPETPAVSTKVYAEVDSDYEVVKVGANNVQINITNAVDNAAFKALVLKNGVFFGDALQDLTKAGGKITIDEAGTYVVYVIPATAANNVMAKDMTKAQKVTLLKDEAVTMLGNEVVVKDKSNNYRIELSEEAIDVPATSGYDETPVVATLYNTQGTATVSDDTVVVGAELKISTNSSAVDVNKTTVTTNAAGVAKFKVSASTAGTYKVYVEYGAKADATLTVTAGVLEPAKISLYNVSYPLVALDQTVAAAEILFQITDINGNIVKPTEDNSTNGMLNSTYFGVKVVEKPAASTVDVGTYGLMYNETAGAWVFTGPTLDEEGEYTFKVMLNNGAYANANITVKEFQTPVELKMTYKQDAIELNGEGILNKLYYVDANGVAKSMLNASKQVIGDIKLAANGYAIDGFNANNGTVTVKADEKYVGSKITVTAISSKYNLTASVDLVVANEAAAVKYASTEADVAVNNTLTANIVDVDGNKVALNSTINEFDISYVVLDKPADAKVAVSTLSQELAQKGQFKVSFTASEIGEYELQTVVTYEQADGVVKYYSGVETITVGNTGFEDIVVMSVGSNEIVKNAKTVAIDAAPIVENNRTFVPFRALAEAFGATVAYDEATQAVTAELNGTTVVMTIGSAEYTVNGVAKTADVAPFINGSRTMVPVRFVAQAFGITVTPTYDDNGATADILFAK